MYVSPNFKTKKEFRDYVAKYGGGVTIYQPNDLFGIHPTNGTVFVEGPHYPQPHTWYAEVLLVDGKVTRVK